jgi:hypothetical protein
MDIGKADLKATCRGKAATLRRARNRDFQLKKKIWCNPLPHIFF